MNIFEKFYLTFGFTSNERRVMIFLVSAFVIGGTIKVYKSSTHVPPKFNYASADSEFAAKSSKIREIDSLSGYGESNTEYGRETPTTSKVRTGTKINLNTATKEELMKLPGVGEATAEEIMNYRDEREKLKSIDELMSIKGIGKKKFEHMKPFLTVGK